MGVKTVLEFVQNTLSSMDGDLVDSINDVFESEQIAELLRECYYNFINRQDWDFLKGPINPISAGDTASPTKFTLEQPVRYVEWLRYNIAETGGDVDFKDMVELEPAEFLARYSSSGDTKQYVTVGDQIGFYVNNDRAPSFYTTFNDVDLYFDSFDDSIDTTLISSKLFGKGVIRPDFQVQDTFIPTIPNHLEQLLQHELNSAAHLYFKQQASPYDERERLIQMGRARRNQSRTQRQTYYAFENGR